MPAARRTDPYAVLDVPRGAGDRDIRRAYRRLARDLHPDTNPDPQAAERFREAADAYALLSDPEARASYDRAPALGLAGLTGDVARIVFEASRDRDPWAPPVIPGQPRRGRDYRKTLTISLDTAVHGGVVPILVASDGPCPDCQTRTPVACTGCDGGGLADGPTGYPRRCPSCSGTGRTDPCEQCAGTRLAAVPKRVSVAVPPNTHAGASLHVPGGGGHGPAPGDLYVDIDVEPHQLFERVGTDLWVEVGIDFDTAALGGTVHVPRLRGEPLVLKVPPRTRTGQVFRLTGLGSPSPDPGDLYVQVRVQVHRRSVSDAQSASQAAAGIRSET